jgi:hypothetical protein
MKKLVFAFMTLLLGASSAFPQVTSTFPVTVPGGGTNFNFSCAVLNTPPCWPLMSIWDGTTKMTAVSLGQALATFSIPVVPPITTYPQDPCFLQKKSQITLTSNSTGPLELIPLAALNTIYICALHVKPTAATIFNLVQGVGTNCTGGSPAQAKLWGDTTVANGVPFSGLGDGTGWGSGLGTLISTIPGDAVCFTQTAAELVSITIDYVKTQL